MDPVAALIRISLDVNPRLAARVEYLRRLHQRDPATRIMARLVSRGDVVVDLGASWGVYTWDLLRLVGPSGHVHAIEPLLDMGVLKLPLDFSFVMGVQGGVAATARCMSYMATEVLEYAGTQSTWKVVGISRDQWVLNAAALSLGGNVRVGLEDNFYLPNGQMVKSNGDLVAQAALMARAIGREPASVDQARKILQLS